MHSEKAISEALILATCNRLEFFLYAQNNFDCNSFISELVRKAKPEAVGTWNKYKREIEGMDVVQHIFEVAVGLDWQMIGENQILSQVKKAYHQSVDCRMSRFLFHKLFHKAFKVGRTVREQTDINCGAVSIGLAAVELAKTKMDLSAGTDHIMALTSDGKVFDWDWPFGDFPFDYFSRPVPPDVVFIEDIDAGYDFSVALSLP